jgi:hypothetical protein
MICAEVGARKCPAVFRASTYLITCDVTREMVTCVCCSLQFLNTGNDIAARETCPCIWIINPRETGKVLQHVMRYGKVTPLKTLQMQQSFRQPAVDMTMITAGGGPGTVASAPNSRPASTAVTGLSVNGGGGGSAGAGRSLEGEMGTVCVYTGDTV